MDRHDQRGDLRARVAPADRSRKFLGRFAGQDLEVALEATTGWRFVVEELQHIGADVHLAEPAETSALKRKRWRAKTEWADARHQRELLSIGRLPESWIPPAHLLALEKREWLAGGRPDLVRGRVAQAVAKIQCAESTL